MCKAPKLLTLYILAKLHILAPFFSGTNKGYPMVPMVSVDMSGHFCVELVLSFSCVRLQNSHSAHTVYFG